MGRGWILTCGVALAFCVACSGAPAERGDQATGTSGQSTPAKQTQSGTASFMADRLHGQRTASGEIYDRRALVAAHPSYPLGSMVRVTNEDNGRVVEVKIIDRTARSNRGRIIDLSRAAAERLDFIQAGTVKVRVEVLEWGSAERQK